MSGTLAFLWRNRERPAPMSHRWFVVWAKRSMQFFPLLRIIERTSRFRCRGASIGRMSAVMGMQVNGRYINIAIGDGAFVGNRVHIAPHAAVTIGANAVISEDVRLLTASHDLMDEGWPQTKAAITIGPYAWVATGATILPGVTIGRGAVVGAGAVITRDVPAFALAIGNPARVVLNRRSKELTYRPTALCAPFEAWIGHAKKGSR